MAVLHIQIKDKSFRPETCCKEHAVGAIKNLIETGRSFTVLCTDKGICEYCEEQPGGQRF